MFASSDGLAQTGTKLLPGLMITQFIDVMSKTQPPWVYREIYIATLTVNILTH